jgi:hypothetical protein
MNSLSELKNKIKIGLKLNSLYRLVQSNEREVQESWIWTSEFLMNYGEDEREVWENFCNFTTIIVFEIFLRKFKIWICCKLHGRHIH